MNWDKTFSIKQNAIDSLLDLLEMNGHLLEYYGKLQETFLYNFGQGWSVSTSHLLHNYWII